MGKPRQVAFVQQNPHYQSLLYKFGASRQPTFVLFNHIKLTLMETTLEHPTVAQAGTLRAYMGGHFRVLVAPAQTHNAFALLDMTLARGTEPPQRDDRNLNARQTRHQRRPCARRVDNRTR